MKNRRQFPSLCRYFFLSYPTKKGGFLFLPVLQGFKTPARTPYIVKLYAKIFMSMFACPFSLQKSYPFFLFSFLSIFCVFRCFLHKKGPPPLLERKAISFISFISFIFGKSFLKKENQLRGLLCRPLAISVKSIFSVRTRNGEIPCRSASLSRSAVSRS